MTETLTKVVQVDLGDLTPHHRFQVVKCNEILKECKVGPCTVLNVGSAEDPARLGQLYDAVNLDPCPEDCVENRGWHPKLTRNFVEGDAREIPFPDKHFRCVVVGEVFEHICDDDAFKIMREVHRVLVEHGQCIVTLPIDHRPSLVQSLNPCVYLYPTGATAWHSNVWDAKRLSAVFEASHLVPTHVSVVDHPIEEPTQGLGIILSRTEDVDITPHPFPPNIGLERDQEIRVIMDEIDPKRIICTGVASNDNVRTWAEWYPDAEFICFDLFNELTNERAESEGCVPPSFVCSVEEFMIRSDGINCAVIAGDTKETMVHACEEYCEDGLADCAFLGGGHSYDTVLNELLLCQEYVRPGGVVIVEDRTLPSVDAAVDACKGMGRWDAIHPYMWVLYL